MLITKYNHGFFTAMDTTDTKGRIFKRPNETSHAVIDSALRVHSVLGAGMLESAVCACLLYELTRLQLHVQHQVHLPLVYQDVRLPTVYRVDFIVEKCLIVEVKCGKSATRPPRAASLLPSTDGAEVRASH